MRFVENRGGEGIYSPDYHPCAQPLALHSQRNLAKWATAQ